MEHSRSELIYTHLGTTYCDKAIPSDPLSAAADKTPVGGDKSAAMNMRAMPTPPIDSTRLVPTDP